MTVEQVNVTQVECQWFSGSKLSSGWFPIGSLEIAPSKNPETA
jgi:hypothetical protein